MTTAPLEPGTWTIDAAHTLVEFSVRHMTVARVTGRFAAVSGEVKVPDGDPLAATVSVSIDVPSVASGHPKRDELIRSADFLDAERFPVITFTSEPAGLGADGQWRIPGMLTIKGISQPVTLYTTFGGVISHRGATRADSPRRPRSTARTSASRSARSSTPAARSCPTRSRSASRSNSSMLSLVSALLPPGTDPRSYTPREQANIETVLKLRSAPFSERKNYMHPAMVRHRWGFASLADVSGMKDGAGYDASTCSDRVDTIEDLIAKDDRVWAVWTMRGTHTGQLFGIPPTGKPIEILEAGIWRLADGLVIEAWFFGDELRLLRQLGVIDDAQLRAATVSPARPARAGRTLGPVRERCPARHGG